MIGLMADLFAEGYGDGVHVDRERTGITWATFGHLYVDYYVFQYATGISGANALARRILAGTPGAVEDYLSFLKAGDSLYPVDALKLAGVDLTTPRRSRPRSRCWPGWWIGWRSWWGERCRRAGPTAGQQSFERDP